MKAAIQVVSGLLLIPMFAFSVLAGDTVTSLSTNTVSHSATGTALSGVLTLFLIPVLTLSAVAGETPTHGTNAVSHEVHDAPLPEAVVAENAISREYKPLGQKTCQVHSTAGERNTNGIAKVASTPPSH